MARSRTPLAKAAVEGRQLIHPERYRARREPTSTPLAGPPSWLQSGPSAAFRELRKDLLWLQSSHTAHVVITALLLAKLQAGIASIPEMNLLRLALAQLGANPVTSGRFQQVDADEHDDLLDD